MILAAETSVRRLELLITVRPLFFIFIPRKKKRNPPGVTLNLKKFGRQGSQDSLVYDTGPIIFYPASARVRAEINLQSSRMRVEAYLTPEIEVLEIGIYIAVDVERPAFLFSRGDGSYERWRRWYSALPKEPDLGCVWPPLEHWTEVPREVSEVQSLVVLLCYKKNNGPQFCHRYPGQHLLMSHSKSGHYYASSSGLFNLRHDTAMEAVAVSFEIEIPSCVPGVHNELLGLWVFHYLKKTKHGSDQMDVHN
ncbi:hypothetical protein B0H13DRAFT_1885073 [Mycena leptocephala]|nr:hypothetical protein B0H13DRAFT_1885073 [Mycena leptocephala]